MLKSLDIKTIREQILITKEGDDYVATHPIHPTLTVAAPTLEEAESEILRYVVYLSLLFNAE
jgi:hypothetical protein